MRLVDAEGIRTQSFTANPVKTQEKRSSLAFMEPQKEESTLSIVVIGASGDLARNKIFPALFALFYEDHLPEVYSASIVNYLIWNLSLLFFSFSLMSYIFFCWSIEFHNFWLWTEYIDS